jgi:hypothetical protein
MPRCCGNAARLYPAGHDRAGGNRHRVIYKSGLLSRHTIDMNRDKIESG